MQPEQKKVCNGECGQCKVRRVSDCCESGEIEMQYLFSKPGEHPICLACSKDCSVLHRVETPQYVSKKFSSVGEMTHFLNIYGKYHDHEMVTVRCDSGFFRGSYFLVIANK